MMQIGVISYLKMEKGIKGRLVRVVIKSIILKLTIKRLMKLNINSIMNLRVMKMIISNKLNQKVMKHRANINLQLSRSTLT